MAICPILISNLRISISGALHCCLPILMCKQCFLAWWWCLCKGYSSYFWGALPFLCWKHWLIPSKLHFLWDGPYWASGSWCVFTCNVLLQLLETLQYFFGRLWFMEVPLRLAMCSSPVQWLDTTVQALPVLFPILFPFSFHFLLFYMPIWQRPLGHGQEHWRYHQNNQTWENFIQADIQFQWALFAHFTAY